MCSSAVGAPLIDRVIGDAVFSGSRATSQLTVVDPFEDFGLVLVAVIARSALDAGETKLLAPLGDRVDMDAGDLGNVGVGQAFFFLTLK